MVHSPSQELRLVGLLALAEFGIARNRNYSFAAELLLLIPEKK